MNCDPQDTMRPLQLTSDEQHVIAEDAERVIAETLAVNELFIASGRKLPKDEWKRLKSKENIQVYRSRKTDPSASESGGDDYEGTSSSTTSSGALARSDTSDVQLGAVDSSSSNGSSSRSSGNVSSEHSVIGMVKPSDTPLVIATGIISGTVDDVMFGSLAHTEPLWRFRDAHTKGPDDGMRILASIVAPTPQDPFRCLNIKWAMNSLSPLARKRDGVYIEATGIALDYKGERVGYYLMHSIDSIARIPGLKHLDIVRVQISTCCIIRSNDQTSVEFFCRGFSDPGGNFAESIGNILYADLLLSAIHIVDCAYAKKLIWLMHTKRRSGESARLPHSTSETNQCESCATKLSKLANLIYTGVVCEACLKVVCRKCSVVKKISMEESSGEVKPKPLTFCLPCVIEAKEAPTNEVAIALTEIMPSWS